MFYIWTILTVTGKKKTFQAVLLRIQIRSGRKILPRGFGLKNLKKTLNQIKYVCNAYIRISQNDEVEKNSLSLMRITNMEKFRY